MAKRSKKRPGAMFFFDWVPALERLSDEDKGKLLFSALKYAENELCNPEFAVDSHIYYIWPMVQAAIDRDRDSYDKVVIEKSIAASYRYYEDECRRKGTTPMPYDDYKEVKYREMLK